MNKRFTIEINGWKEDEYCTFDYVVDTDDPEKAVDLAAGLAREQGIEVGEGVVTRVEPFSAYRYVNTSELRKGDVVNCHGMRCLIDREINVSRSHPEHPERGETRYTQALVLNRDDVPTEAVPFGWTADWKRDGKYEQRPHDGQHRWTIQGNDLARWAVEEQA